MSALFIGRLSNGAFRAAVAKPGFDAGDPATRVANMQWTSELSATRLVAKGQVNVGGPTGSPGSAYWGSTTNVTIPQVVGGAYIRCLVQAVERWNYWIWVLPTSTYSSTTITQMATGWYQQPRARQDINGAWFGANVDTFLVNSTTLGIRTNNAGNGTNNLVRVRYAVFESR